MGEPKCRDRRRRARHRFTAGGRIRLRAATVDAAHRPPSSAAIVTRALMGSES